jgi:Phosphate transporter family
MQPQSMGSGPRCVLAGITKLSLGFVDLRANAVDQCSHLVPLHALQIHTAAALVRGTPTSISDYPAAGRRVYALTTPCKRIGTFHPHPLCGHAAALCTSTQPFLCFPHRFNPQVVGAVLGMTAAGTAPRCLQWAPLAKIAASWIVSPLLAGALGAALYTLLQRTIILSPRALSGAMLCAQYMCAVERLRVCGQRAQARCSWMPCDAAAYSTE